MFKRRGGGLNINVNKRRAHKSGRAFRESLFPKGQTGKTERSEIEIMAGKVIGIDEHLVVPNRSLSVYDGAIVCWRGEKMGEWREELIHNAEKFNFPIFTPYSELTD